MNPIRIVFKLGSLLFIGLIGIAAPDVARAEGCDPVQTASDASFDAETGVTFINRTPFSIKIYWASHEGDLIEHAEIGLDEEGGFHTSFLDD